MKRNTFALCCLFLTSFGVYSQSLTVQTIELSNYNQGSDYDPFWEHHWGGPTISLTCILINSSSEALQLSMDYDSVELSFRHNLKDYVEYTLVRFPYEDRNALLQPGDSITFKAGSRILLGTDLYRKPEVNYSNTMLQVLPTLSIVYFAHSSTRVIGSRNRIDVILRD